MKRLVLLAAAIILTGCRDDQPVGPRAVDSLRNLPTLSSVTTGSATVAYLGTYPGAPNSIARAINASGVAAGDANVSEFAVRFGAQVDSIPADSLSSVQVAEDINDGGLIVGSGVQGLAGAVFVRKGFVYDGSGFASFLPLLPFSQFGEAYGVNNAGDVVGLSRVSGAELHAVLWRNSGSGYTITDLGSGYATAIAPNLTGASTLIVGVTTRPDTSPHAFIWQNGVMTELPPPPGVDPLDPYWTEAYDVADNAMVVGTSGHSDALLWHDGQATSLGAPCRTLTPGGQSVAHAIAVTSSAPLRVLIVGTCSDQAIVWYDDGQGGYAAELLPPLPGDNKATAYDVNAAGQIVGYSRGTVDNVLHAVRWTFTPPATQRPPVASVGGPYTGTEGILVAFDGSGSSDPDGQALAYDWDFGDGFGQSFLGPTPFHAYEDNGTYTVTLIVDDAAGGTDTASTTVTIANALPQVSAGSASTLHSGQTLAFGGSFSDSGVHDGTWQTSIDWGDGTPPTVGDIGAPGPVSASHTYFATGSFTLQLSITDKDGGTGTATRTVTVTPNPVGISVLPNPIPLGDKRVKEIDLVILSAAGFDARLVDPASVRVGNGTDPDALAAKRKNGAYVLSLRDVDRDGLRDLQLAVDKLDPNLGLAAPTTALVLRAALPTADGTIAIRGAASVNVTP